MPGATDTVELTVERIGVHGDGIAVHEGERVFLPLTAPGDRVRARLGPRRAAGRAGTVESILAPGARQAPPCPHFGACGGCALQHLDDGAYAAAKLAWLAGALAQARIAAPVAPLIRLAPGTRRRARLALEARGAAGFHGRASHAVVDLQSCAVLHPALAALLAPLRGLALSLLPAHGKAAAILTLADTGIDLLLELPAPPDLAAREALAAFAAGQGLARLSWRRGAGGAEPVAQHRPVEIAFGGVAVEIPPDTFLQASAAADRVLAGLVLEHVGAPRRVADLYAGLGTLTFPLARHAAVHAVERDAAAVAALRAAAARAGLAGRVTAEPRDLVQRPLDAQELARFDAVVFDPPRGGARAVAAALAASGVPRLVAVSCNPATFARDARLLIDGGYRLEAVQPVDSFTWSPHLELVARFAR